MTIPKNEALRLLRAVYKGASVTTRAALVKYKVPMRAESVPGWEYYADTDAVAYTGGVVGGN